MTAIKRNTTRPRTVQIKLAGESLFEPPNTPVTADWLPEENDNVDDNENGGVQVPDVVDANGGVNGDGDRDELESVCDTEK